MNAETTPNENDINNDNVLENYIDYEEYYLIEQKVGYKFIIIKYSNKIIIKCKNYRIILNNKDLSLLTKSNLNTIDDAYLFIINIFERNEVNIKNIEINHSITLLFKIYVCNKSKDIEMKLSYKKTNKNLNFNELNNNYNNLKKEFNNLINEINKLKNEINELKRDKINSEKNIINNKMDEINNIKIKKLNVIINNKNEELNNINNNEYINKINYIFIKEPQYLKYKLDITKTNTTFGWNDIFEIFISYKDNKEYLISPNINNFNLDIFRLLDNKIILSLLGHKNIIRTVRYFIDKKSYNEYLISGDDNKIVIIWDITNDFSIKHQIDTKYEVDIYSCLLLFPYNIDDNYIITSTYNKSDDIDKSSTKIYSLNNGKFIKYIKNTNNIVIYYLLSWYNKKNNNYYIIEFSYKKIIINNLMEDELYSELRQEPEDSHFSGFIYEKENNDYLCSSSSKGYINIWDLYNKKIYKTININKCKLAHIIDWNNKYIIVADYNNKSFKIIDLEENKMICNINGQHTDKLACVKKIYHPIYGESLLSAAQDNIIKLWII